MISWVLLKGLEIDIIIFGEIFHEYDNSIKYMYCYVIVHVQIEYMRSIIYMYVVSKKKFFWEANKQRGTNVRHY